MKPTAAYVRSLLVTVLALVLVTFLAVAPVLFEAEAVTSDDGNRVDKTQSHDPNFPYYDIRNDKRAIGKIAEIRSRAGRAAPEVADIRDNFVRGENKLRARVSSLKVEYNKDLRIPEMIGPDVRHGKAFLTPPSSDKRPDVLRHFLRENVELTGVAEQQLSRLNVAADYKNPENDLSFVHLEQEIDGVPVFRGEVKAGFARNGEIVRVINNLAPGLNEAAISRDFGDPVDALHAAVSLIGRSVKNEETFNPGESTSNKVVFGQGDWATIAEKIYFPTEPGVAVPAWRVLIWEPVNAYYVIVDASDGTLLWRKNITEDQTQSATYNVWVNPNAMVNVADSPFPMTPGPISPNGTQGTLLSRTLLTRIGNEAPYTFNNNGWITDGGNTTEGNAVRAGLDRDTANGVDAARMPVGNSRTFDFPINPGAPVASGLPPSGDAPLPVFSVSPSDVDVSTNLLTVVNHGLPIGVVVRIATTGTLPAPLSATTNYFVLVSNTNQIGLSQSSGGPAVDFTSQGSGVHTLRVTPNPCSVPTTFTDYQKAVVTQLFFISNWYHDETYRLGFTESARNFQLDNFGRGGAGGDRVSAEAQDCSGANNANFSTPPDGTAGRMQMYIFTPPTPDFDGSLDADIVIHELTHGLSNRLHGNGTGLSTQMAGAMGEGWSDFYAHAMLSESTDPIEGIYPTGGYATYLLRSGVNAFNNYYYGIRRFPKAVMSFKGANGKPHNPLTFGDVDPTKIDISDGAFSPAFHTGADGVHAAGEVWSSALWEVRAKYIEDLGWEVGNRRVLQHITDGMKLAPFAPTFLQERDAIIAAAQASGTSQDVDNLWEGFAIRGLGFTATVQNVGHVTLDGGSAGEMRVTESFDMPNLLQEPGITFSDVLGDNDGVAEPGEPLRVSVPLANRTGKLAQNVFGQIVGGSTIAYGSIANNGTASSVINYTVPTTAQCGSLLTITINVNSNLGPISFERTLPIGHTVTFREEFDSVIAPAVPAGWTISVEQNGIPFVTTTNSANTAPNAAFAANSAAAAGATSLVSPLIPIELPASILTFRNRYDTEQYWDGGVLEISIGGGPFADILDLGGAFIENGYNSRLTAAQASQNYVPNPLNGRNGWSGSSGGYVTTRVQLPPTAAGQNVQLRFRFGADSNTAGIGPSPGWYIDNIEVMGQAVCNFTAVRQARADFNGDGRTDLSVFRPSNNHWYIVNSITNVTNTIRWGLNGDVIVPGNYDGDLKADLAVFRPATNTWHVFGSDGGTISTVQWGLPGDFPVPGDYDGDGKTDYAVFRPSNRKWYIRTRTGVTRTQEWGLPGDIPVPLDYNGDKKTDIAIYRNGQWWIASSGGNVEVKNWGLVGDRPVPADYDGDGKDDLAVWRPSNGRWYIVQSSNGNFYIRQWGLNGDIPVPGDYDGDRLNDLAVWRNGTWHVLGTTSGVRVSNWGLVGDKPVPEGYIPRP